VSALPVPGGTVMRMDRTGPPSSLPVPTGRVGIKKPTQKNPPKKNHPKKTQKNHIKNPLKMFVFLGGGGFFKFLIFYENNCTERPCIFSWPMMIFNSVDEFFVAV
jgi:hypothetical protein